LTKDLRNPTPTRSGFEFLLSHKTHFHIKKKTSTTCGWQLCRYSCLRAVWLHVHR